MKSKLRIKRAENGMTFAVITHKFISKDDRKLLIEWRDEIIKKKAVKV